MSEERAKILKMLKEGRITVEEAELLLDALAEGEQPRESEQAGPKEQQGARREERRFRHSERHQHWGQHGGWFDLDLPDFGMNFQETFKGWKNTLEEFLKNAGNVSWESELGRMFGKDRASRTLEQTLSSAGASVLSVTNGWGDVEIRASELSEARITAHVSAWGADAASAQQVADGVTVRHYRDGDRLVIEHGSSGAAGRARYKIDFELVVPRSLRVEVRGMSGNLTLAGSAAGAQLATLSGDIALEGVSGEIEVDSKSGDIELRGCAGDVKASTVSGELTVAGHRGRRISARSVSGEVVVESMLEDGAELSLKSVSGDLRLKLPESAAVELEAETSSGEVDCDLPLAYTERGSTRVRGVLRSADGHVALSTKSGSIAIRRLA